jgi:hypothetical protein
MLLYAEEWNVFVYTILIYIFIFRNNVRCLSTYDLTNKQAAAKVSGCLK